MRIRWILVILSIAFCSCESKNPSAASAAVSNDSPEAPPKSGNELPVITLDAIQQQKGHVVVEPARIEEIAASLRVPGKLSVNDDQTWHVGAIASGSVDNISARVGDSVSAGQALGLIHSHEVHEARAGYQEAITELQRARAEEDYAKQRRDRAQRLLELKAGSRQDLETAEADLRNAQASTKKAQSELEKERAHLEIFHLPFDEPASNGSQPQQEDDIPIVAPALGLVLERKATQGSVVSRGEQLFTITDTSTLWMIAAASELDLSHLSVGQRVRIQVRAYSDREFSGRILKLGEELDPATRTLQVRILVPNEAGRLKPEMYATATLSVPGRRLVMAVPEEAVQEVNGVPVIFIRHAPNEFEARPVKTGQHLEGKTEVLEGLSAGEDVAVQGSFLIKSQILKSTSKDD
ncbi:MAG TPA: efflux RND transporter periplasmic adaptor subunit [Bryobacteraceae bacterium]